MNVIDELIGPVLDEILPPLASGPRPEILYGPEGCLDSMGLLRLVVMLEERIEEKTGRAIKLVSNEALSQTRSPFASVASLEAYIAGLLG